mmetsp:Transcript_14889/g.41566  ORF Transcript_14889/g.41566 Transcript_14889/m.41566 type:complete len:245 (-) Transcript_14889:132-866(-)
MDWDLGIIHKEVSHVPTIVASTDDLDSGLRPGTSCRPSCRRRCCRRRLHGERRRRLPCNWCGRGRHTLLRRLCRTCWRWKCLRLRSAHWCGSRGGLKWRRRLRASKGLAEEPHFLHKDCHLLPQHLGLLFERGALEVTLPASGSQHQRGVPTAAVPNLQHRPDGRLQRTPARPSHAAEASTGLRAGKPICCQHSNSSQDRGCNRDKRPCGRPPPQQGRHCRRSHGLPWLLCCQGRAVQQSRHGL